MLFKNKNIRVVILGVNNFALEFAEKASKKYSIILIGRKHKKIIDNMDLIFIMVEKELISSFIRAEIEKADFFISLSMNDEYNLFAADLAKLYGVKTSYALVRSRSYLKIKNKNIDYVFNPYNLIIDKLNNFLKETRIKIIDNFISDKVDLCKITIKNKDRFSYLKIAKITINEGKIIAVEKNDKIILARDNLTIYPDDSIFILYKKGKLSNVINAVSIYKKRKLFLNGINELGKEIIKSWHNLFSGTVIIESDLEKCHHFAEKTNKVLILNGEGTDINLLKEEGLSKKSIFISISSNNLANLMGSFTAREIGCNTVVSVLDNNNYIYTGKLLDLDNIISTPSIISNHLLSRITHEKINDYPKKRSGLYIYPVKTKDYLHEKKLMDIKLSDEMIIALLERNNKYIFPVQNTKLKTNDKIFLISRSRSPKKLYKNFLIYE